MTFTPFAHEMRALDLPNGGSTLVDTADLKKLEGLNWYRTPNGYVGAMSVRDGKRILILLHRHLTNAPPKTHVDHINGDRLDNRQANLRVTTPHVNQINRRRLNSNNHSGARGVTWDKRKRNWKVQITVHRKNLFLGNFASLDEAIARRKTAEAELWVECSPC